MSKSHPFAILHQGFLFLATAVFTLMVWWILRTQSPLPHLAIWLAAFVITLLLYASLAPLWETSLLLFIWWLCPALGIREPFLLYLPLMLSLLIWSNWKMPSKISAVALLVFALPWLLAGADSLQTYPGTWNAVLYGACLCMLFIHVSIELEWRPTAIKSADIILCSYSGNTAHYARHFSQGMKQAGAQVFWHRFHYQDSFKPQLQGNALVLAFPVSGWKPPWPYAAYLIRKLPYGHGKPAYVLYTAMGGPENAGAVVWFLLRLKGYRLQGRQWAPYPNNVVTFRLGPKFLWRWIDTWTPWQRELEEVKRQGQDFASGQRTGLPVILWPFPLIALGILLDNRWMNILCYRNYVWRWRCIKCQACIRHCPTGRLRSNSQGFPQAKGTCALCLGCINFCPKNAMHLLGFSEYGQQYHPRWPELVVKSKDSLISREAAE